MGEADDIGFRNETFCVAIMPMIGNRICFPKSSGENKRIVSVFDLQGRLVYRSEVAGQVVAIGKQDDLVSVAELSTQYE